VSQHNGLSHPGLSHQSRLDLAQLDAVAPQLDLMIQSPEAFKPAVGPHFSEVPRTVQTLPCGPERIGDKALSG
jgi:hypothetical protein